jgi:hypothetical protein
MVRGAAARRQNRANDNTGPAMNPTRRTLILSAAAGAALAACGGGSDADAGDGGGGLGSVNAISITSVTPASVPAVTSNPVTFTISCHYDLETQDTGIVSTGYGIPGGAQSLTGASQVVSRGAGTLTLTVSVPASALVNQNLEVLVNLGPNPADVANPTLVQDAQAVPRTT